MSIIPRQNRYQDKIRDNGDDCIGDYRAGQNSIDGMNMFGGAIRMCMREIEVCR